MLFPRSYPFTMVKWHCFSGCKKIFKLSSCLFLWEPMIFMPSKQSCTRNTLFGPSNVKLCISSPQYMTKVERNTWASLSLHLDHDVNGFPHTSKHVLNGHLYSDFLSSGQSKRLTTLPYSRPYMHTPTAVSATARWEQLG